MSIPLGIKFSAARMIPVSLGIFKSLNKHSSKVLIVIQYFVALYEHSRLDTIDIQFNFPLG